MKKRFYVLLAMFLLLPAVMSVSVHAAGNLDYYTTASTATSNAIEVSKAELKKAKNNAKKNGDSFSYSTSISEAYQMHIYHFEAPTGGYYNFYTTGSTDTVIKVYEHQNFMWWTTDFKDLGLNDDGCCVDISANSSLKLNLTRKEDYYVCVRAFGTSKGSYTLHVEPNEDKILPTYCSNSVWSGNDYSFIETISQNYPIKKEYLTKEQVILFYWCLTIDSAVYDADGNKYTFDGLYNAYNESTAQGISYANTIVGLLCCIPKVPSSVSFSATILGTMISTVYDELTSTTSEMRTILQNTCGANCSSEESYWKDGAYYELRKYTATSGLCVTNYRVTITYYDNYGNYNTYSYYDYGYEAYQGGLRVGSKYDKGTWSK